MVESCWSILGLEQTADKKLIKRAYSKHVKLNKPDQNPNGFARLRDAYEEALEYAEYPDMHDIDEPADNSWSETRQDNHGLADSMLDKQIEDPTSNIDVDNSQLLSLSQNNHFKSDHNAEENEYQQVKVLIDRVQQLVADTENRGTIKNWRFLFDSEYIFDLRFRRQISFSVFETILNAYKSQSGGKKKAHFSVLPSQVLSELDTLFDWSSDDSLQDSYEVEDYFLIVQLPAKKSINKDEKTHVSERGVANLIDWILLLAVSSVLLGLMSVIEPVNSFMKQDFELALLTTFGILWLAYNFCFEVFFGNASFGKRALGMYVGNRGRNGAHKWKRCLRLVCKLTLIVTIVALINYDDLHASLRILVFWVCIAVYSVFVPLRVFSKHK